jgi:hypothetical protein
MIKRKAISHSEHGAGTGNRKSGESLAKELSMGQNFKETETHFL